MPDDLAQSLAEMLERTRCQLADERKRRVNAEERAAQLEMQAVEWRGRVEALAMGVEFDPSTVVISENRQIQPAPQGTCQVDKRSWCELKAALDKAEARVVMLEAVVRRLESDKRLLS